MGNLITPKNAIAQTIIAGTLFILFVVGAYHIFMDWLLSPLSDALEYISSMHFVNKALLVVLILGVYGIYSFRTRKT